MDRWSLLYDADCGFCTWTVAALLAWDRHGRLAPAPIQGDRGQELFGDLTPAARLASVHLVDPAGERFSGGPALPPLLRLLPGGGGPARVLERAPRLTARGYDWVAAHRSLISRLVPSSAKRRARRRVARACGRVCA